VYLPKSVIMFFCLYHDICVMKLLVRVPGSGKAKIEAFWYIRVRKMDRALQVGVRCRVT